LLVGGIKEIKSVSIEDLDEKLKKEDKHNKINVAQKEV
jgi:hypothetical protein